MAGTFSPASADLAGATVTIGGYCCSTPTAPDLFTTQISGTVPVSFPVGALKTITSLQVIPASFDVTADQVSETADANLRAASGGFNGPVFSFTGLLTPITHVSVDPASTFMPVSVAFTSDSIAVNVAGLTTSVGAKYILDVTTGGTVATPEPGTFAVLVLGLAGVAAVRRGRVSR